MEHGKLYLRVTDREVDKVAQRVDTCPAQVLLRAYYTYKGFMSFIWELSDLR